MKTVFIDCSPKKRFCASAYFLALQRLFVRGEKAAEKLRTPADHGRILEQLRDADAVVFGLPLYVDGIPSHVLRRMGSFIRRGACSGKKYTRILIPSFIFILFADAFFIIVSFFEGGLFRGWLAKKGIE